MRGTEIRDYLDLRPRLRPPAAEKIEKEKRVNWAEETDAEVDALAASETTLRRRPSSS
jgi:hypothetical protein